MSFRFDVAADTDVNLDHRASAPPPRSMTTPASRASDGTPGLQGSTAARAANSCSSDSAMRSAKVFNWKSLAAGKRQPLRHGLVIERTAS